MLPASLRLELGQSAGEQLRTNGSQPAHCLSQWGHPLPQGTGWGLTRIRGTGLLSQMLTLLELEVGAVKGPEEVLIVCGRSKFRRPKSCRHQGTEEVMHFTESSSLATLAFSFYLRLAHNPPK